MLIYDDSLATLKRYKKRRQGCPTILDGIETCSHAVVNPNKYRHNKERNVSYHHFYWPAVMYRLTIFLYDNVILDSFLREPICGTIRHQQSSFLLTFLGSASIQVDAAEYKPVL